MTAPLLALFTRSLREDARNRRTYWTRLALSGFLLLALFQCALSNGWVGAPGRSFLAEIVTMQMVAITLLGLSYFTSAIAEEKEAGTLGLLRMTGLDALSILLGKGTSRLCGALLLLTAQIPFTIFAITLGGVSLRQVAAVYCTLAAYTFLLSNLALLGSVLARRTGGAVLFCIVTMVVLLNGDSIFANLHDSLDSSNRFQAFCGEVSVAFREATPFARMEEVLGTNFNGFPLGWQVASNLALGTGCFLLAWACFDRFCDRTPEATAGWRGWTVLFGGTGSRPPRPWKAALSWKDFYFLCGGRLGFALRVLAYGGAVALLVGKIIGISKFDADSFAGLISFIFALELALMAARIFRVELNQQTLASLAVLPCGMQEIARAKARACLFVATPGAVATIAFHLYALHIPKVMRGGPTSSFSTLLFILVCGWITLFFLVHFVAWLSLHLKRGALPVGFVATYVGGAFIFGICLAIFGTVLNDGLAGKNWWTTLIPALFPIIAVGATVVGFGWMIRGVIPLDLEQLAGEQ